MALLLFFLEIFLVYQFIQIFDFLYFLLFYFGTTLIGFFVFKGLDKQILMELSHAGPSVAWRLVAKGLLILSGVLLIIPSLISKIFGLILLIPPIRYLVAFAFGAFWLKKVFHSQSRIFQFGGPGFGFFYQSNGQPFNRSDSQNDVIEAEYRSLDDSSNKLPNKFDS